MLDAIIRKKIDPTLNRLAQCLVFYKLTANTLTLAGFCFGLIAMLLIVNHHVSIALVFLVLNRLCDGLDGAVARHSNSTDFGAFLDIGCDFIVYAGVVCAFGMALDANLPWALFLIFSFIGPMVSFLAYGIIAEKRQLKTSHNGIKSFYHLGGLCEGTETAVFLILMCMLPLHFKILCLVFGVLCWLTTFGRVYRAWLDFGNKRTSTDAASFEQA